MKKSLAVNLIIVALTVLAFWIMFAGIHFMGKGSSLESSNLSMLRFFTVDSNLLMGVTAAIFVVWDVKLIHGKISVIPKWLRVLKFAATTGVGLTMIVTVCWLGPISRTGYLSLFLDSNLFFHLVLPLLAIISYCMVDRISDISFRETLYGTVPMLCYAVYYLFNALMHSQNGVVPERYDWYCFLTNGSASYPFVLALIFALTWGIGILIRKASLRFQKL